jgi:hypothetical protein
MLPVNPPGFRSDSSFVVTGMHSPNSAPVDLTISKHLAGWIEHARFLAVHQRPCEFCGKIWEAFTSRLPSDLRGASRVKTLDSEVSSVSASSTLRLDKVTPRSPRLCTISPELVQIPISIHSSKVHSSFLPTGLDGNPFIQALREPL